METFNSALRHVIYGIRFHYDNRTEVDELGRHSCDLTDSDVSGEAHDFLIDGPGGERIESLSVFLDYTDRSWRRPRYVQGALIELQVTYLRCEARLQR